MSSARSRRWAGRAAAFLLEAMWRERGLTMVLVTHDSSIARRAQRIGVMKNGHLSFRPPGRSSAARPEAVPAQATRPQAAPSQPRELRAPDLPDLEDAGTDTVTFD